MHRMIAPVAPSPTPAVRPNWQAELAGWIGRLDWGPAPFGRLLSGRLGSRHLGPRRMAPCLRLGPSRDQKRALTL